MAFPGQHWATALQSLSSWRHSTLSGYGTHLKMVSTRGWQVWLSLASELKFDWCICHARLNLGEGRRIRGRTGLWEPIPSAAVSNPSTPISSLLARSWESVATSLTPTWKSGGPSRTCCGWETRWNEEIPLKFQPADEASHSNWRYFNFKASSGN